MKSSTPHTFVSSLSEIQAEQLHALFQNEWWSTGRTREGVRTMLEHTDFIFGVADPESQRLMAFARVLTDRAFKALILDVIVHPDHRSAGLGSLLMNEIMSHPIISKVRHVELYCRSERLGLYERHGFTADLGDVHLMRRILPG